MPAIQTTFTPLQWKNGINPKSQGSFQTFMKQLADWANTIQNQVTRASSPGNSAGWAFYTGSMPSVTTTPTSISNWVLSSSSGMAIALATGTTFTVGGISTVVFQGTAASALTVKLNSISGTGIGGNNGSGLIGFSGLASSGSFTVQANTVFGTSSISSCSLGIFLFNL